MSRVSAPTGGKARVQQAENEGSKRQQIENSEQSTREAIISKWKEMEREGLRMMQRCGGGEEKKGGTRKTNSRRKTSSKLRLSSFSH